MEEKRVSDNNITIGKEISILRISLSITQEDFAKHMLISRVSLNKLEKLQEIQDITNEMAFRLYYATQKIIENPYLENFVKDLACKINKEIVTTIENRIQ